MAKTPIKTVNLLPEFLRTDKNSKFLSSTIDQMVQAPSLERIDGFVGSKLTSTFNAATDVYLKETQDLRRDYQLEPALIVKNGTEIKAVKSYDDLINEIAASGGITNDLDRLFRSEFYSFNPSINWDKFVNFQNYYWLPTGPDVIDIFGTRNNTTSEYSVVDNEIKSAWIFTPNGLEEDPVITLYRGNTYIFDVDSIHKFYIKTAPSYGTDDVYNVNVTNNGVKTGRVTITVDNNTPQVLYYTSDDQIYTQGQFVIKNSYEDSTINVETEILGKKTYVSGTGIALSNGMKVKFGGDVQPTTYKDASFYVEGVGESIRLIDSELLISSETFTSQLDDNFESTPFDTYPYDKFRKLPITPEYITISRGSKDLNPWTRYNRWVHGDVIRASAEALGKTPVYPASQRASRPIIEFNADLKLYNFGSVGIKNVDLIDNTTPDAFSAVEGSAGYYVDGVLLDKGHRVIFNADTDSLVRRKIFEVNYVEINGQLRLELNEVTDVTPQYESSVSVNFGDTNSGKCWWFNGDKWIFAQQHTSLNQAPLFDLYDQAGVSFSSQEYDSNFVGTKIFGYATGTGNIDPVLGFPLSYKSTAGVGSYIFKNYIASDEIEIFKNNQVIKIPAANAFYRISKENTEYRNVWQKAESYEIPILQLNVVETSTDEIELTAITISENTTIKIVAFIDNVQVPQTETVLTRVNGKYKLIFDKQIDQGSVVLLKIYTNTPANIDGWYETPIGLTNNPLNENIEEITLTEAYDHYKTMIERSPDFSGSISGVNNSRDLENLPAYGSRLVANLNPIAFASFFIGFKENSVVDAITTASEQYAQFKSEFLRKITTLQIQNDPSLAVDTALKELNSTKDINSAWHLSDMVPYGNDKDTRQWTITDSRNTIYPLSKDFNLDSLSSRAVLVYLNGKQLIVESEYQFLVNDSAIEVLTTLNVGDILEIHDYFDTTGCYVPATPTKLGLYPKFIPEIFDDLTYANGPVKVIQGHDGSLTVCHNDYRDEIILEFERRIFNNIKCEYSSELFNIFSTMPGAFRDTDYSIEEVTEVLQKDFVKWAGVHNVNYYENNTFDSENPYTWNYANGLNPQTETEVFGTWRAFFKYFYDTDRPHTHPWEMLGLTVKPTWWDSEYGVAPYTSGNSLLWDDLEKGIIRFGEFAGVNELYARPGLSTMLPVDENGNLRKLTDGLVTNYSMSTARQSWKFGDIGPVENAWRRSSQWPFAVQRLMALIKSASYSSLMYDVSRMKQNIAGQWVYGTDGNLLDIRNVKVFGENGTITNGYSVYVSEIGKQRDSEYLNKLRTNLDNIDFNLFYKVGGFVSKNKIQVVIDAIDPSSTSPGAIMPPEDYDLFLNVSNPVKTASISGIIVQKVDGKFVIKGYDKYSPYFNVVVPNRSKQTAAITVGGVSESFLEWAASVDKFTNLTSIDVTSASSSEAGNFYQIGQIVKYNNRFYRVKVSHKSGNTFDSSLFQSMPELPVKGGATVQLATSFSNEVIQIPYGTEFSNIQDVYDTIVGYGKWLETQGFVFDSFNSEINSLVNWELSGKEFLYWTTQNWASNSIITLSPFANYLKFSMPGTIVDNIYNSFYEYSILRADGVPQAKNNLIVSRDNSECVITTKDNAGGIYFAQLNAVQKEHAMVFNNTTVFNDVVYNTVTGYRQRRMKLSGFRTAEWNGDYISPGFVYDTAVVTNWKEYKAYTTGDVVKYNNSYYSANKNISGASTFDFTEWSVLGESPVAQLLPNFEYKITQFEDFYSLDIDNFDSAQQQMAQHLTGYTPRVYLNNIFTNPISQYKFYQGFIKEKGTKNAIDRLAKATIHNLQGEVNYTEEWAFRVGNYGAFETYQEIEVPLTEGEFIENPQILAFSDVDPGPIDLVYHVTPNDFSIIPADYDTNTTFSTVNTASFKVNVAGYVNFDDVTATAYNENSILDIANNSALNEGDTIWLGFKQNGDWDVLRYTNSKSKVVGVFVSNPGVDITFVTDSFHGLSEGSLISVVLFNDQVNGVYKVTAIPALNQITVGSSLTSIMNAELLSPGQLFVFESARAENFDRLPSDSSMLNAEYGTNYWVDNETLDGSFHWKVYRKERVFNTSSFSSGLAASQQSFGYSLSKNPQNNLMLIGAPTFNTAQTTGRVFAFERQGDITTRKFAVDLKYGEYHTSTVDTQFGHAVEYSDVEFNDTGFGLLFASAPNANNIFTTSTGVIKYASKTVSSTTSSNGLVKISSVDPLLVGEVAQVVLTSPTPSNDGKFGAVIHVNTVTGILLVSEIGLASTGTVYSYSFYTDTANEQTTNSTQVVTSDKLVVAFNKSITNGAIGFGNSIATTNNGLTTIIGSPNNNRVEIYTSTNITHYQTLTGPEDSAFGSEVCISQDGVYVLVSAPTYINDNKSIGRVYTYKKGSSGYLLDQILINPLGNSNLNFGKSISISKDNTELVISAIGNTNIDTEFLGDSSFFDNESTTFYDLINNCGSAYIYNRLIDGNRFVLATEIESPNTNSLDTTFGHKVLVDTDAIYISAPAINSTATSTVYQFTKLNANAKSLSEYRSYTSVVDIDTIQKLSLVDIKSEKVVEYLELFDPLKGKIPGLADQEIKYKTSFDPAIYSIGIAGVVTDTNTSWLDEHVGELWWDLSSVKYVWYEQGSLTYRKNNWGAVFPGATIDVYEWVGTPYLPAEWSSIADTSAGLTEGVSGQPKFADNSVLSVKQIYNPSTNSFVNQYYYWVKNRVVVPNVSNRRISAYQIASMIANPTAHGLKYVALLSNNALAVSNVDPILVDSNIHLNIAYDKTKNKNNRHTEWLILQENSASSMPNSLLEKKLIDSLMGHDSLGNLVPDPTLTSRTRYGISIRPRQTMFKDRKEALRNLIEFSNSVLKKTQITGNYSFANLEAQDAIPDIISGAYDQVVEDNFGLDLIDTQLLKSAKVECIIKNGKILSVYVTEPGFGYKQAPTITINGVNQSAEIATHIDSHGRVTSVEIKNAGSGYETVPVLEVRPYTVIVSVDSTYNNKWAKFIWDTSIREWVRVSTQKFNTTLYWDYVDWADDTFNEFIDYSYTVDNVYQLDTLEDVQPGQYVKVKNVGDNRYVILRRIQNNQRGTFGKSYDLVYKQEGTIQISNTIWDTINTDLAYDYLNNFDQTLYDQTPDIELFNILSALKNDIFINELKLHWNQFFFKAVKYALTEQKLLDWVFKTSFINVVNYAGSLDQRPVYKVQNSEYYEQYIREVKPYRTQLRTFTTNYELLEPSNSHITDFDLPPYYDDSLDKILGIEAASNPELITIEPWKSWFDNYLYEVGSIVVGNPGYGYVYPPQVIVETMPGDSGSGAKAEAIISSGKLVAVNVTNPGSGYKQAPNVILVGGNGPSEFKTAVAYAQLYNGKVRSNIIGIQFNRISSTGQTQTLNVVDKFICNGSANEFVLGWYANPDKSNFTVTLDGELVLSSYFKVSQFTKQHNGYSKKYSKIVFVSDVPRNGQLLEVSYVKNIELFNAADRIKTSYQPTAGMPGNDLGQLMDGVEYPKTTVTGLQFSYSSDWDLPYYPYDETSWADNIGNYTTAKIVSTTPIGTDTVVINTTTGVSIGNYANIISTSTNKFSLPSTLVLELTPISSTSTRVTLSSEITTQIEAGETIEFWEYDTSPSILDTNISGGGFIAGDIGVSPTDIIIDGNQFISPYVSNGPEEFVPGRAIDSIGINVYTKHFEGAPTIISGIFDVNLGVENRIVLTVMPPSHSSIFVTYNNKIFSYSQYIPVEPDLESFTIDWVNKELIIGPQTVGGKLGYTIVGVGGGLPQGEIGLLDAKTITVPANSSNILVESSSAYTDVKTAYVTVNGVGKVVYNNLYNEPDINVLGLSLIKSETSDRAVVKVDSVTFGSSGFIQVWFFGTKVKHFNELLQQQITVGSTGASSFVLSNPPLYIGPESANTIVEIDDGLGFERAVPPFIAYYGNTTATTFAIVNDLPGSDIDYVRVFINGTELAENTDYTYTTSTVTLIETAISESDVVAVLCKPSGITDIPMFDIVGNVLSFDRVLTNSVIRVTTFTDHDDMLMKTYRFKGNSNRQYKLPNKVLDDNYIWVMVDGIPLKKVDYKILVDGFTIEVTDSLAITTSTQVVITTLNNNPLSETVIGYRIFNDVFNKTHFKRLSKKNTTRLARPLLLTDDEIHVEDASVLTPPALRSTPTSITVMDENGDPKTVLMPNVNKTVPGVIMIDGERIEFFKATNNVLSQLRRSTIGTGPKSYVAQGTQVIDQSVEQDIPYSDTIKRQTIITTNTNTYVINTTTLVNVITAAGDVIESDGIVLQTSENTLTDINGNIIALRLEDQVEVFYGGRLLRKDGVYYHDSELSYDSPECNILGTVTSTNFLSVADNIGDAYLDVSTNKVWVYENSLESSAINGYIYKGLQYSLPEFTISVNGNNQQITLNIDNGVREGIKLTLVKREYLKQQEWNTVINGKQLPLINSTSSQALFLKAEPAPLPEYISSVMVTSAGQPLFDINGPLEGK